MPKLYCCCVKIFCSNKFAQLKTQYIIKYVLVEKKSFCSDLKCYEEATATSIENCSAEHFTIYEFKVDKGKFNSSRFEY